MSRYDNGDIAYNDLLLYKETLEKRGVKRIKQYRVQTLKNRNTKGVDYFNYIWKDGDQFWKLSNRFYNDPQYWYIIAKFNNTPTDAHVSVGDQIKIPIDLAIALQVVV